MIPERKIDIIRSIMLEEAHIHAYRSADGYPVGNYINIDYDNIMPVPPHNDNAYARFAVLNALYAVRARRKGKWV